MNNPASRYKAVGPFAFRNDRNKRQKYASFVPYVLSEMKTLMENAVSAPTPIATRHLVETPCKPPEASGCDGESLASASTPGSICSTIVRHLSELCWPFGDLTQAAPISDSICRGGPDGAVQVRGDNQKGASGSTRGQVGAWDVKHRLPNSGLF